MTNINEAPLKGAACVALALALAGSCAFAQAQQTTEAVVPETELAPVTVSAHDGLAVPYDQTGVSVSILDIPELKKEGVYSLTEALTTVPGVYVQPGGGDNQRGNVSHTTLRGMSSDSCVLPMIDGMRIHTSSGGGILTANTVARTDLFSLGNVEVLKGAQGALYGGGAQGGVIYMTTPEGKGDPSFSIFNEAGSYDSYTGNFTAQGQVDKLSYFVSVTYNRTNNDVQFADGTGSVYKHGGKYENWNEAIRLDYQANETNKLTFTYRREDSSFNRESRGKSYDWTTYEFLGYSNYFTPYDFRSNLVTGKWQSRLTDKWTSSIMAGYYGYDATLGQGYYQDLRNVQIEWRNKYKWNDRHATTGGFSWNRSQYDYSGSETDNSLDNVYGLFIEHTYTPVKGWENSLALRLDQSNLFDEHFTFRAASSYKFNQERTRIHGSAGTGYRAPGSFQCSNAVYHSPYGSTYYGNPDLDCEESINVDFGIEQQIVQDHYVNATLFWTQLTDAIDYDYDASKQGYVYTNANGHWTSQGIELSLHGTFEKNWNTGYKVAWTYTQPKTGEDKQIYWTARQVWSADLHTSPIEGLTTGIGLAAAVGRSSYKDCPYSRVDNYYTLRWYAQYEVNEHLTLHVRVENLTNQKYTTEASYYGPECSDINSGIGIYGGCTIKF